MSRRPDLLACCGVAVITLLAASTVAAADTNVRVGVYPGPPVSVLSADGEIGGIYPDLLREVARREGWTLQFVPGSWPEGLARLDRREIDLMVGVGFSAERAARFSFSDEPVLSNWGQLYVPRGSKIQSILDLDGATVAVLREDIYYQGLRERVARFSLDTRFAEVDTREAILELVAAAQVDAGLVSRLTGVHQAGRFDVQPSSVVCCPVELRLAAPRGASAALLARVDAYLREAREDRGSAFHRSLDHWLDPPRSVEILPGWFVAVLLIVFGAALMSLLAVVGFRRQLRLRTAELRGREADLRQAQKLEAVGRLASGIAHDFNNRLTIIDGYCDLLLADTPIGDPARPRLLQIRRAAEDSAALTQSLLAVARKQILRPEDLPLDRLLDDLSDPLRRMIGEDIRFELQAEPGLGAVHVDPVQVRQAIMNLVVNARDAMPDGGDLSVELRAQTITEVSAGAPGAAGQYLVLAVADTGDGIPPELLDRVFEPFFTTKPIGEGTGLGLAMVHGFAAQSGGFVTVTSAPDDGARFELFLPRVAEPPAAPLGDDAPVPGAEAPADTPLPGVILVVEDEVAVRTLVVTVLEMAGHQVVEATNVHDALTLAEAYAADLALLLTDVVMPDMKGPEVAARVRELVPGLPTLFVTGYSGRAPLDLGDGPSRVLQKPFTPRQLRDAVVDLGNHDGRPT